MTEKSWNFHTVILLQSHIIRFRIYICTYVRKIAWTQSLLSSLLFYVNGHSFRLFGFCRILCNYLECYTRTWNIKFFAQLHCLKTVKMCYDTKKIRVGGPFKLQLIKNNNDAEAMNDIYYLANFRNLLIRVKWIEKILEKHVINKSHYLFCLQWLKLVIFVIWVNIVLLR